VIQQVLETALSLILLSKHSDLQAERQGVFRDSGAVCSVKITADEPYRSVDAFKAPYVSPADLGLATRARIGSYLDLHEHQQSTQQRQALGLAPPLASHGRPLAHPCCDDPTSLTRQPLTDRLVLLLTLIGHMSTGPS